MAETQLMEFFANYGWQLTLIAVAGVVVLGVLKYANVFARLEKEERKPVYLCISIGLSVIGSAIYLAVIKQFDYKLLIAVSIAIYAINQTFYSIYENTKLRDLLNSVVQKLIEYFDKN